MLNSVPTTLHSLVPSSVSYDKVPNQSSSRQKETHLTFISRSHAPYLREVKIGIKAGTSDKTRSKDCGETLLAGLL